MDFGILNLCIEFMYEFMYFLLVLMYLLFLNLCIYDFKFMYIIYVLN